MVRRSRNTCLSITLISIWTLLQTIIHISLIGCAYLLSICLIKPTYYDSVFVYLTYFYKESCGPISMRNETFFLKTAAPDEHYNESGLRVHEIAAPKELYEFLVKVLNEAELPSQSRGTAKTELYLVLLFITDAVWIVATVVLCAGACFKIHTKKVLSIIFYGPWLLCSAFINFLDVACSVHYGLDLIYIQSYTTWLTFIGVSNPQIFTEFDDLPSSAVVPLLPTSVLVSLLSRFVLVWLINVICFFTILFLAIPDMMPRTIRRREQQPNNNANDLNSSEARIRNWFQFYGNIEANSTMAINGTSSPTLTTNQDLNHPREVSFNCNTYPKNKPKVQAQRSLDHYSDPSYTKVSIEGNSIGYQRFQDVDSGIMFLDEKEFQAVNAYAPWSYITPKLQLPKSTDDSFKVVQCTRL